MTVNAGLRYDGSSGFTGGHQISPRIGLNLAPDDRNVVHLYYGRFYAAPQLEDVRADCVVLAGCASLPTYDLKPQSDAYGEFGVAHTFSPLLRGSALYFQRSVVNVLDTTQLLTTPIFAVYNNAVGQSDGVELRLDGTAHTDDTWSLSTTFSESLAAGISGSTFLFAPDDLASTSLQPEDHDQTYAAVGTYTHHFGTAHTSYVTLRVDFGTGFPVEFQNGTGRLPSHLTGDLLIGRKPGSGGDHRLGYALEIDNIADHQYPIKIANGFNTTQIANGRSVLFRVTAPLGR